MTDAEFHEAQEEIRALNRRTLFAGPTPNEDYESAAHHAEFGSAFPVK